MNIWTVACQKGGVGKTTTAVTLAGLLAESGLRTLLIDLDPHGSLTSYFGYDPDAIEESVYSLFQKEIVQTRIPLASILCRTNEVNLDILPASTALVSLDRQVGAQGGRGLVIKNALQDYRSHYHTAIIDCPPTLGILMVNALAACQRLLIPVQTEFLAIKGLDRILNTLKMIVLSGKQSVDYTVIPTMFDRRTRASNDSLYHLQKYYYQHLWQGHIPIDTKFREASSIGKPVSAVFPETHGVMAYRVLLDYLVSGQQDGSEEIRKAG